MKNQTMILGIASAAFSAQVQRISDTTNYEIKRLIEAGKRHFDSVQLIHPELTRFEFVNGKPIRIFHNEVEISNITSLIMRNTGKGEASSLLTQSLITNGCD